MENILFILIGAVVLFLIICIGVYLYLNGYFSKNTPTDSSSLYYQIYYNDGKKLLSQGNVTSGTPSINSSGTSIFAANMSSGNSAQMWDFEYQTTGFNIKNVGSGLYLLPGPQISGGDPTDMSLTVSTSGSIFTILAKSGGISIESSGSYLNLSTINSGALVAGVTVTLYGGSTGFVHPSSNELWSLIPIPIPTPVPTLSLN